MRLSFRPEPLERLRARYLAAIDHTHDIGAILRAEISPPSTDAAHIFDFEDGFRLIVSAETLSDGRRLLHLSASLAEDADLMKAVKSGRLMPEDFVPLAESRYRDLSGDSRPIKFLGFSPGKGVPHWSIELTELPR
jgi:hypothetical protein